MSNTQTTTTTRSNTTWYTVYGIYDKDNNLARTGVTRRPKGRANEYDKGVGTTPHLPKDQYTMIPLISVQDKDTALDYEDTIIAVYKPPYNKNRGCSREIRRDQRALCRKYGLVGRDYDKDLYDNNPEYREEYKALRRREYHDRKVLGKR